MLNGFSATEGLLIQHSTLNIQHSTVETQMKAEKRKAPFGTPSVALLSAKKESD